ncbi:hypothetical protein BVC80_1591g50 [Macleaya cordata]|uniref:Uncharacterized protein n=1 Tax=Macleaya cordata TaxID=56857 RepID=A0A200QI91_MACCD|nr:hypothetical protein BVC80_1591g50 [Macleaya cordata]
MHLWPSLRIRDSFKTGYLKKLEWNLNRMNSQKKESQTNQKLLQDNQRDVDGKGETSSDTKIPRFFLFCRELLMLLSCCYCCFCCGDSCKIYTPVVYNWSYYL